MSFQDSSRSPMMNDDDGCDLDETSGGIEVGELFYINPSYSGSQEDGSIAAAAEAAEVTPSNIDKFGRAKRSIVWVEFDIITLPNGDKKRKCKWCGSLYAFDGKDGSTSNAKRHLGKCIERLQNLNPTSTKTAVTQAMLNSNTFCEGSTSNWKYDHEKVRKLVAQMVLVHEYPFNIVEDLIFNKLLKAVSPWYKTITRHTVKADCENYYTEEKVKMKNVMTKVSKIGLTTELWWSEEQKIDYMTVTAHFIDSKWQLHKRVLAFCDVLPPNSGDVLAQELIRVMEDWSIKEKVVSISVENVIANDDCITRLKLDFSNRLNLPLDGQLFYVRCCANILNLLVQDGLKVIKPIVEKIRSGVKYLLNSEVRCMEFNNIVKELGLCGRRQVLDDETRWNSTFLMLSTALYYKHVWPRYAELDSAFLHYLPDDNDWEKVGDICKFLEVFSKVINVINRTSYPTVNIFLNELFRVNQLLDKHVDCPEKPHLMVMACEMRIKYSKYWSQSILLFSIGAILDPRYKMVFIEWVYQFLYPDPDEAKRRQESLSTHLASLFSKYQETHQKKHDPQTKTIDDGKRKRPFDEYLELVEASYKAKTDLENYLDEDVFRIRGGGFDKFDVLEWWMAHASMYPILSILAKDILSIPVTTVDSEAIFSFGKRMVDPKRASLKTETLEMLFCGGEWAKEYHGIKNGHGNLVEEDELSLQYNFGETEPIHSTTT